MSNRHTSKIFLTAFDDSAYDVFGDKSVTANRHTQPLIRMDQSFSNVPGGPALDSCCLPDDEERQAFQLRTRMGLKDGQIAKMLDTTRETVNRRISRYCHKVKTLSRLCPSASCELLERLAAN